MSVIASLLPFTSALPDMAKKRRAFKKVTGYGAKVYDTGLYARGDSPPHRVNTRFNSIAAPAASYVLARCDA